MLRQIWCGAEAKPSEFAGSQEWTKPPSFTLYSGGQNLKQLSNKLTSDLQWTRGAVPLLAGLSSLPNCFVFCPFGHQDFASFSGHLILTVIWNYFLAGTVISIRVPHDSKKQRMQTCYPFVKSPECWIWRIFKLQLFRIFIIDFFSCWLVRWKYTHIRTK